jgi:plasmid maintenance system antidote protein VapI
MTGNDLRNTLAEMKISQGKLSKLLEVDRNTVSRWVTGATPVPGYVDGYLRMARAVCELADVIRG